MIADHGETESFLASLYCLGEMPVILEKNRLKRDLPNAVVKYVDNGHFALEFHHSEIAGYIKDFLR